MTAPPAWKTLPLVATGGAVGTLARWSLTLVTTAPLATLSVNVVGTVLLAAVAARRLSEHTRLFVATGFCSSFTTYSAFAVETLRLGPLGGVGYLLASYGLGLAGAMLATREARR